MDNLENSDELYHYGRQGMKWYKNIYGSKKQSVSSNRKKSNDISDDASEAYKLRKKKVKQMSNAELRKVNERIQLERQYGNLNPSHIKKGMAIASSAAAIMGTVVTVANNAGKMIDLGKKITTKFCKD